MDVNPTFGQLFKFLRLKSGYKSISHFANALAEEDFVYGDSLFSHWQRGARIPTNRDLILALITIFIKNDSLTHEDQVNLFLQTAKKRKLESHEKRELPILKNEQCPLLWEIELEKFITRDNSNEKLKSRKALDKEIFRFNFMLSSDTYNYFEKASKRNRTSKADFLRKLIREHKNSNSII